MTSRDRQRDTEVAEHIFDWQWYPVPQYNDEQRVLAPDAQAAECLRLGMDVLDLVPAYSTRIEDAWQVVEYLRAQGWTMSLSVNDYETEPWDCRFFLESKTLFTGKARRAIGHGATAPEAICVCALRAGRGEG